LGDQRAFQVSLFCPSASLLGSLSSPSCAAVGSGEERRVRGRWRGCWLLLFGELGLLDLRTALLRRHCWFAQMVGSWRTAEAAAVFGPEMKGAAVGLCRVELERTMGEWFCFVVALAGFSSWR
jgi:hypothetical protein